MPADVLVLTTRPDSIAGWGSEFAGRGYSVAVGNLRTDSWLQEAEQSAASVLVLDAPSVSDVRLSDIYHLRALDSRLPYLVVVGAGDVEARVRVLNAGADACLVSDVSGTELAARVLALVRRAPLGTSGVVFSEGDLSLDLAHRAATYQGRQLLLSPYAFRILRDLALQVMECRTRLASSTGDDRLTNALQRLRDYAEDLGQESRPRATRQPPPERPSTGA